MLPLLIGFLALSVLGRAGDRPEILRPIRVALVGFLAIETAVSVRWFIPPPTVFLGLATASFGVSLMATKLPES